MTPTPAADVFKWVNHQRRDDREKPNHGTDQRQMVGQCLLALSTPFLEILDSKVRSERTASHTHPSHLMSPSPAGPFVARTVYRRNKILVSTPSGCCTGGGFINEVLVAASGGTECAALGNL